MYGHVSVHVLSVPMLPASNVDSAYVLCISLLLMKLLLLLFEIPMEKLSLPLTFFRRNELSAIK